MNYDIAKRIKRLRTERGLKQEDITEALHVTRQAVSNWENGKTLISVDYLMVLSEYYGISMDELVYGRRAEEAEYKCFQTRYVVCCIVCGVLLLAGAVLNFTWLPKLEELRQMTFVAMPVIYYTIFVYGAMAAAFGVLLPSIMSLKADIRLGIIARRVFLWLGIALLAVVVWFWLAYLTGFLNPHGVPVAEDIFLFLLDKLSIVRVFIPFLAGAGLFFALNK